jgi:hypothetical protein
MREDREYYQKRRLKKIEESRDPLLTTPSGYAVLEIPYGERFTAARFVSFPLLFQLLCGGITDRLIIHN